MNKVEIGENVKGMRFYKNRKYAGIRYNESAFYVGLDKARKSGIKEVFTRTGKPYSKYDACVWILLPVSHDEQSEIVKRLTEGFAIRTTNRVVESPRSDICILLESGYDIITIQKYH
ncbi:MAG: hypothetical protein GY804_11695 [Alphaproteobacteria bacterium]|nr:hypothetical protein [Alphaproteobacteria bacterium]